MGFSDIVEENNSFLLVTATQWRATTDNVDANNIATLTHQRDIAKFIVIV